MPYFNIVAETNQNTVVTEYEPVRARADSYQSEAALEQEFIRLLGEHRETGDGSVLCLDCAFSAVGESEEQRA